MSVFGRRKNGPSGAEPEATTPAEAEPGGPAAPRPALREATPEDLNALLAEVLGVIQRWTAAQGRPHIPPQVVLGQLHGLAQAYGAVNGAHGLSDREADR